jgi:hypothetical protein
MEKEMELMSAHGLGSLKESKKKAKRDNPSDLEIGLLKESMKEVTKDQSDLWMEKEMELMSARELGSLKESKKEVKKDNL